MIIIFPKPLLKGSERSDDHCHDPIPGVPHYYYLYYCLGYHRAGLLRKRINS